MICFRNCITVFEYGANVVLYILRCLKLRALILHIVFRKHRKAFCLSMFSWPKSLCKFFFFSLNIVFVSKARPGDLKVHLA